MARLVPAGVRLRAQVDKRFPKRDRASDGWIGDKAHQSRLSDHNPDRRGLVHAIDIDADLVRGSRRAARALADEIVAYARSGKPGSDRIKYVVFDDQIASGTYRSTWWKWRGSGYGHEHHIHVSFTSAADDDARPFPLPIFNS
jgi:hypothetical protein